VLDLQETNGNACDLAPWSREAHPGSRHFLVSSSPHCVEPKRVIPKMQTTFSTSKGVVYVNRAGPAVRNSIRPSHSALAPELHPQPFPSMISTRRSVVLRMLLTCRAQSPRDGSSDDQESHGVECRVVVIARIIPTQMAQLEAHDWRSEWSAGPLAGTARTERSDSLRLIPANRLAHGSGRDDAVETPLRDPEFRRVTCGARDAPLRAGETPALHSSRNSLNHRDESREQLSDLSRQGPG